MSIVSRVFDKYQWIKGDWGSMAWEPEKALDGHASGFRNIESASNYDTCLGACAMGIIHIDTMRKRNDINECFAERMRAKECVLTSGMQLKNEEYTKLFISYLQAAIEVISNTVWNVYALEERNNDNPSFCETDFYGNYSLEVRQDEDLPTSYGIIEWNDRHTTKEEDVRDFMEILSIHREYVNARNMLMLPDFKLAPFAKGYIERLPLDFLDLPITGAEVRHYERLKGANVI